MTWDTENASSTHHQWQLLIRTTHQYLGPVGSSGKFPTLSPKSAVIPTTEKPPPSPHWWDRYNIEERDASKDLDNLSPTRSPSPLDDDLEDVELGEEPPIVI